MEIEQIIKHCQNENKIAQGVLFNRFYHQMYNLSMRVLANQHDTEDVLIISFTKIFKKINTFEFRGEHSLTKWIKTIVINESIRFINNKKPIIFEENLSTLENNLSDFQIEMEEFDTEFVYSIIESMSTGYRTVFNLFAIEGYTHKEIAKLLNISENTSKSQLRKARLYIIENINKVNSYEYSKH